MTAIPVRKLAGGQLQELMDTLLYTALTPVVENTDLFDPQLSYVLSLLVTNKKRRPCAADPEEAIHYLIQALHASRDQRMEFIKKLRMERNFVYGFLRNFLATYERSVVDGYTNMLKSVGTARFDLYCNQLNNLVEGSGATSRAALYHTVVKVAYVLPDFFSVFDAAVNNFVGFCSQQAQSYVAKNPNHNYDVADVTQNFIRATITALNKYDCSRGAQAGYVKWWIMHAQTCGSSEHEYGLAYTIPQSQRKRIAIEGASAGATNFSVSLDQQQDEEGSSMHDRLAGHSEDLEHEINRSRQVIRVAEIAKCVDPYGLARLQFDMDEVFFPHEIQLMRQHMESEKL